MSEKKLEERVSSLEERFDHAIHILASNMAVDYRTPAEIAQAEKDAESAQEVLLAHDEGVAGRQTAEGTDVAPAEVAAPNTSQVTRTEAGTKQTDNLITDKSGPGTAGSGGPTADSTVEELDAFAESSGAADYPKSGNKAEKLKALGVKS